MRTRLATVLGLTAGMLLAATSQPAAADAAGSAGSLTASTQPTRSGTVVDAQGRTVGGWVELGASSHSTASASATDRPVASSGRQDVGGGVWTYGSYDENGQKHCWSKYYNSSYYHSATAVMTSSKKVYAWQFDYADAHISESIQIGALCKVYWATYP